MIHLVATLQSRPPQKVSVVVRYADGAESSYPSLAAAEADLGFRPGYLATLRHRSALPKSLGDLISVSFPDKTLSHSTDVRNP